MGDLRSGNEGVGARSLPRSKATSWDVAGRNHEAERGPRQVDNPPEAKGRDDQRPDSRVHEGLCTLGQESVVQIQGLRAQGHHVSCPHGLGRPAASPGAGSTRPCSPAGTGTSAGHTGWRRTSRRIPACTYLNTIHKVLMGEDMAEVQPKKSGRRRRVRYERTYSNSMWHTDYNLLDDGRWFIVYMDDASRCITGFGVFDAATGRHALDVLGRAMEEHGIPASILTDRGRSVMPTSPSPGGGAGRSSKRSWPGWTYGTWWPASTTRRPTASWRGSTGGCNAGRPGSSAHHTTRPSEVACRPCGGHIPPVGAHGSCGQADQVAQPRPEAHVPKEEEGDACPGVPAEDAPAGGQGRDRQTDGGAVSCPVRGWGPLLLGSPS